MLDIDLLSFNTSNTPKPYDQTSFIITEYPIFYYIVFGHGTTWNLHVLIDGFSRFVIQNIPKYYQIIEDNNIDMESLSNNLLLTKQHIKLLYA